MHPVLATVLQRLGLGLATLFAVSVIIFISIEMLPGDFGQAVLGQAALPETVAAFRKELGLDKPPYIRYFDWIAGVVQGDLLALYEEMRHQQPVSYGGFVHLPDVPVYLSRSPELFF